MGKAKAGHLCAVFLNLATRHIKKGKSCSISTRKKQLKRRQ